MIPILPSLSGHLAASQLSAGPSALVSWITDGGNDDRQQADQLRASYVEKMKSFVLWLVDCGRVVRLFTTDVHDDRIMHEVLAHLRAHRPELCPSQVIAEPSALP